MKKIDVGQMITIIANVGVIAGIVFLGIEIRQNSSIARASAFQENVRSLVDFRQNIAESEDLARLWSHYLNGTSDELQGLDVMRQNSLIGNLVEIYQTAFFSKNYGFIGDDEWRRFRSGVCVHYGLFQGRVSNLITDEFAEFLEAECGTP